MSLNLIKQRPLKPELKIGIAQMNALDDLTWNVQQISRIVDQIQASPQTAADLICFPENCLYLRIQDQDRLPSLQLETEPCFDQISELAAKHKVFLHLGSVPLLISGKLYNSTCWFDSDGNRWAGYQKIHLFDIALEGEKPIRESDVFAEGRHPRIQEIFGWKFGESICYDIRFSELYNYYAEKEVDVLLIPASFLVPTGIAHWETLIRARAIESQAYVVASAQSGQHQGLKGGLRETYGHSMVVSPWGKAEVNLGHLLGYSVCVLQTSEIAKVRRQIPMQFHRRKIIENH